MLGPISVSLDVCHPQRVCERAVAWTKWFGRQQKAVGMLEGVTTKLQAELKGNKQTN